MELVLIKPESNEWEYMWDWLANHPINDGIENPSLALHENQAWEYMGSFKEKERIIHTFRHRHHPVTSGVKELKVSGSSSFKEEDIEKKFRL
jgi:hypothetical protein